MTNVDSEAVLDLMYNYEAQEDKKYDSGLTNDSLNDSSSSKLDEDESPPFEPLEVSKISHPIKEFEESSVDSHLSEYSGLQSQESNQYSVSHNSSDSQSSVMISEDPKVDVHIDIEQPVKKVQKKVQINPIILGTEDISQMSDEECKKDIKLQNSNNDRDRKDEKCKIGSKEKHISSLECSTSKDMNVGSLSLLTEHDNRKESYEDVDKFSKLKTNEKDTHYRVSERRKEIQSKNKKRVEKEKSKKDRDKEDSHKDKERTESNKEKFKYEKNIKNVKKDKKTGKINQDKSEQVVKKKYKRFVINKSHNNNKESIEDNKDVNSGFNLKDQKANRSCFDIDLYKLSKDSSLSFSGIGSDRSENTDAIKTATIVDYNIDVQKLKYIKPKFASNFEEARKIMKIRKQLAELEKQNKLGLTQIDTKENGLHKEEYKRDENKEVTNGNKQNIGKQLDKHKYLKKKKNSKVSFHTITTDTFQTNQTPSSSAQDSKLCTEVPGEKSSNTVPLDSISLSQEKWEALEARLAQEMEHVDYNSYESHYDDYDDDVAYCVTVNPIENDNEAKDKIKRTQGGESLTNDDDICRYLEKSNDFKRRLKFLFKFINKLEKEVKQNIKATEKSPMSIKKGTKRKLGEQLVSKNNKTRTTSLAKKKKVWSKANTCGSSSSKRSTSNLAGHTTKQVSYCSEDLYKPRTSHGFTSRSRGAK